MENFINSIVKKILLIIILIVFFKLIISLGYMDYCFSNYFCDKYNIPHDFTLVSGIPLYYGYMIVPFLFEIIGIYIMACKTGFYNFLEKLIEN